MKGATTIWISTILLMLCVGEAAPAQPQTVSPGDPLVSQAIDERCPSFSWALVAGASAYELAVYRLKDGGAEAQLVLRQRIDGAALSFTPPLERCLARGVRYAWSVRAVADAGNTGWSPLSLFEVTRPSRRDVTEALDVLRSYLQGSDLDSVGRAELADTIASIEPPAVERASPTAPELLGPATLEPPVNRLEKAPDGSAKADQDTNGLSARQGRAEAVSHHALKGELAANQGAAIYGLFSSTMAGGDGVVGETHSTQGTAIIGYSMATTGGAYGVYGESHSPTGSGVFGASYTSSKSIGVYGYTGSTQGQAVFGLASATTGSNYGVFGESHSPKGVGVVGQVTPTSGLSIGVYGVNLSTQGYGVYGFANNGSGVNYGVYGATSSPSGYAGYFEGKVMVTGNLTKGGGAFKIDHPLDPANRYLSHSFVESPDMMDIYNGNVALGDDGAAWIELPEWFEALNRDFRYQLTPIGAPADLYVAREIEGNRFRIAGGRSGTKVSWQVTGIRHDAYANAHRIQVEEDKGAERGYYLHPELFGEPPERAIGRVPDRSAVVSDSEAGLDGGTHSDTGQQEPCSWEPGSPRSGLFVGDDSTMHPKAVWGLLGRTGAGRGDVSCGERFGPEARETARGDREGRTTP